MPSTSPEHLSGVPVSPTSIHLTWDPPELEHHNGEIDGYLINITEIETGVFTQHFSNQTQITIDNLHPFFTYHCYVTAVTVGEGPYTDLVTVITDEAGRCDGVLWMCLMSVEDLLIFLSSTDCCSKVLVCDSGELYIHLHVLESTRTILY